MNVEQLIKLAGGTIELADKLGVARTTVLGWRKEGMIPGSRVAQISHKLNVPADQLLSIVQPPRSSRQCIDCGAA